MAKFRVALNDTSAYQPLAVVLAIAAGCFLLIAVPRLGGSHAAPIMQHQHALHPALCGTPESLQHIRTWEQLAAVKVRPLMEHLVKLSSGSWLQIGANTMDGLNSNDPMKPFLDRIPTWEKFFVEPIPQLFSKLQESVRLWPNSTAVNLAISPDGNVSETETVMYCFDEGFQDERLGKDLPHWANQICSFNPNHIPKHFPGKDGVPIKVTAVSLPELLRRHAITSLRVLLIDTEGFDYHVVKQIPFDLVRPNIIVWEHMHLKPEEQQAAEAYVRSNCYAVWQDAENSVAMPLFI